MEENVERAQMETTNGKDELISAENGDPEAGQMSDGGEADGTVSGADTFQGPPSPRRNPPRNCRPPRKLSYESQVKRSESDQENFERGWKLWQRVKAARTAGLD